MLNLNFDPDSFYGPARPVSNSSQYFSDMGGMMPAPATPLPATNTGVMAGFNDRLRDWGVLDSIDKNGNKLGGWGGLALGAGQSLLGAFMGMKQYGLMKDQLNFQKDAWKQNVANQKKTINTTMEDRQRARVASNPGAYQSVGEYMDKNRL